MLRESDVQLNENLVENTSTHTNLYILLKEHNICLEEATERIKVTLSSRILKKLC